jgi:hypothetical protein
MAGLYCGQFEAGQVFRHAVTRFTKRQPATA